MPELSDTFELPIGCLVRGSADRHRKITIDEMCGIDEELLAHPKWKQNPGGAISELLRRVIVSIPGVAEKGDPMDLLDKRIVRSMFQADRDTVLMHLQAISFGQEINVPWTCKRASCEHDNEDEVDLGDIEIRAWPAELPLELEFELPKGYRREKKLLKKGTMRMPTGADGEAVARLAREDRGSATSALLAALITDLDGWKPDRDALRKMKTADRSYLGDVFADALPGPVRQRTFICQSCGREQEERVEFARFFGATAKK